MRSYQKNPRTTNIETPLNIVDSGLQTALWCHAIVLMFCAVLWSDASSCLLQCVTHNTLNHLLYMMLSCCVPESLYSCLF